jgi:hypothetical protein
MDIEEAREWLKGRRSTWNSFAPQATGLGPEAHIMCAQADAAMTQQAYWIAKAYNERLLEDNEPV